MFYGPRDRTRSHHPRDLAAPGRRWHHPDLTKLQGWKAARAEEDIPDAEWEKEKA